MEIRTLDQGTQIFNPHRIFNSAKEIQGEEKYDFVVCANKALNPQELPEDLAPAITPGHTAIVIIQNGVGSEEPFKQRYPENPVITCVAWTGAGLESPGVVVQNNADFMTMGSYYSNSSSKTAGDEQAMKQFTELLDKGNGHYEVVDNILEKRWEKVVWNAAWNSITAMAAYDVHNIVHSSPEAEPTLRRLMDEVIQVARAQGINISTGLTDDLFQNAMSRPVSFGSSMKNDIDGQRRPEVEVILGHVVRMAKEYNVDTPTLNMAYITVKAIDHKFAHK